MTFAVRTVTPPSADPVTLAEAKRRLRVTWSTEDADIAAMIGEATAAAEGEVGRAFVARTLALYLDAFPPGGAVLRLPRPPAVAVASVTYRDPDGVERTLDPAAYYVALACEPARLVPVGPCWPTVQPRRPEAVCVTYTAGYGAAADVPAVAKAAVLEILAHRWENRGDEAKADLPPVARRLLDQLEYGEVR